MPEGLRLGQLLVRSNLVTEAQLQNALAEQQRWGGKLGEILVRMSYLAEERLVDALARQLGIAMVDLHRAVARVSPELTARIPAAVAHRCRAVPLAEGRDGKSLAVAMADPRNLRALDELRTVTGGARIVPYLAGPNAIARALDYLYRVREALGDDDAGELALVDAQGRTYAAAATPADAVGGVGAALPHGATAAMAAANGFGAVVPNGVPGAVAVGSGFGAVVPNGVPGSAAAGNGFGAVVPNGAPGPVAAGNGFGAVVPNGVPGAAAAANGFGAVVPNGVPVAAAAANGLAATVPPGMPAAEAGPAVAGTPVPSPAPGPGADVAALLRRLEARQQRETRLLVAVVDLLVEKGLFSREEFLARVRR